MNKLITALNASIGARSSTWNVLVANVIIEIKRMQQHIDYLEQRNQMLHDAASLALKAMDGGFAEKVDYAQWSNIRSGVVKELEIA